MSQHSKKCTAPRAFTPFEEDLFDSPSPPSSDLFPRDEKREQNAFVFLHDILNSAGGLRGFLELTAEAEDPDKLKKYASNALFLCDSLIEEIESYRDFLTTESRHFRPVLEDTRTAEILELTVLKLKMHDVSKGRRIEIKEGKAESIRTDKVLLSRILVNMTKNAVEATEEGGTVQIGSVKKGDTIRFWVHNSAVLPKEIQEQFFSAPFSTKSGNRGWGLLSIKLLGENALNGRVGFESSEEGGTCFWIDLAACP